MKLLTSTTLLLVVSSTCSAFAPIHHARTPTLSSLKMAQGGPTINDKFPNLVGETQQSQDFDLYKYVGDDQWAVVFMHPGDFTPVCTTELGQAAQLADAFEKRNVKLVGFSCNDAKSHEGWIKDIEVHTGGKVDFPVFCDPNRDMATKLGILDSSNKDAAGLPMTVRSVYILKPDKTIALMMTYPASSGRNFDEILRCVDSCQLTADNAVATPANWKQGQDCIVNFPLTDAEADEKFGTKGYRIAKLPSEEGKDDLAKHYLRYTKDPKASLLKRIKAKIPFVG